MSPSLASFFGLLFLYCAFWYQTFSAVIDFYDSLVIAGFCWQSWCGQDFRLILQYSSPSQLFFCIIIHNCLSFRPSYWVIDHLYYFVIYQECWLTSWHKYDREWSWIDSVKLGTLNVDIEWDKQFNEEEIYHSSCNLIIVLLVVLFSNKY